MASKLREITITLTSPIRVHPSDIYGLVIEDGKGVFHYFTEEGKYDGWSQGMF